MWLSVRQSDVCTAARDGVVELSHLDGVNKIEDSIVRDGGLACS